MSQSSRRSTRSQSVKASSTSTQSTRLASDEKSRETLRRRLNIRLSYRKLIQEATERKGEIIDLSTNAFHDMLARSNRLYKNITSSRELSLDTEFATQMSGCGVESIQRLHAGFREYDCSEFVKCLRQYLAGRGLNDEIPNDKELEKLNWLALGQRVLPETQATFPCTFMLGPLEAVPPKEKRRAERALRTVEERKAPVQVEGVVGYEERETSRRILFIQQNLRRLGEVSMLQLCLDAESYGQTAENLFYLSFLVSTGHARVSLKHGVPFIAPATPPADHEENAGLARRKQGVVVINYNEWKLLRETLPPLLPHREVGSLSEGSQPNSPSKKRRVSGPDKDNDEDSSE